MTDPVHLAALPLLMINTFQWLLNDSMSFLTQGLDMGSEVAHLRADYKSLYKNHSALPSVLLKQLSVKAVDDLTRLILRVHEAVLSEGLLTDIRSSREVAVVHLVNTIRLFSQAHEEELYEEEEILDYVYDEIDVGLFRKGVHSRSKEVLLSSLPDGGELLGITSRSSPPSDRLWECLHSLVLLSHPPSKRRVTSTVHSDQYLKAADMVRRAYRAAVGAARSPGSAHREEGSRKRRPRVSSASSPIRRLRFS